MNESIKISEDYILVIDTNSYAGPFADELCAYCTGFCGEHATDEAREFANVFYMENGIEDDERHLADEKNPFSTWVMDQQDDVGDWHPCAIWPSRKFGTNTNGDYAELTEENYDDYNYPAGFSVGIYLSEPLPDELLRTFKLRADKFFSDVWPKTKGGSKVKVEGFRLICHIKTAEERTI